MIFLRVISSNSSFFLDTRAFRTGSILSIKTPSDSLSWGVLAIASLYMSSFFLHFLVKKCRIISNIIVFISISNSFT